MLDGQSPMDYEELERRVNGMSAKDYQIGGEHYKDMAIQPSEFITRNKLNWHIGNCVKYVCRYKNKHGYKDLVKAIHYLELELESEYNLTLKEARDQVEQETRNSK